MLPWLPGHALNRPDVERQPRAEQAFGWDETYTLPENLYLAAERGAGERFRTMARAYQLNDAYFFPLANGQNVLPGRHAYSHMNALASAAEAYIVEAVRTAGGRRNGRLAGWHPNDLGGAILSAAVERSGIRLVGAVDRAVAQRVQIGRRSIPTPWAAVLLVCGAALAFYPALADLRDIAHTVLDSWRD